MKQSNVKACTEAQSRPKTTKRVRRTQNNANGEPGKDTHSKTRQNETKQSKTQHSVTKQTTLQSYPRSQAQQCKTTHSWDITEQGRCKKSQRKHSGAKQSRAKQRVAKRITPKTIQRETVNDDTQQEHDALNT